MEGKTLRKTYDVLPVAFAAEVTLSSQIFVKNTLLVMIRLLKISLWVDQPVYALLGNTGKCAYMKTDLNHESRVPACQRTLLLLLQFGRASTSNRAYRENDADTQPQLVLYHERATQTKIASLLQTSASLLAVGYRLGGGRLYKDEEFSQHPEPTANI